MNSRHRVIGFVGVLAFVLAACAGGNEQVMSEQETAINDLRRQVESLRAQVSAKDQEAKSLAAGASKAKNLETQVGALEERLKMMQDMVMTKDEQVAKLEVQLEEIKKKTAAKPPMKKAKPEAAVKPPAPPKSPVPSSTESPAPPDAAAKTTTPAKPAFPAPPAAAKDKGTP